MARKYRLKAPFRALRINSDHTCLLCTLPTGAELEIAGRAAVKGYIEVVYSGERYRVFEADLLRNSEVKGNGPDHWFALRALFYRPTYEAVQRKAVRLMREYPAKFNISMLFYK